ncbi:MAG: hypothetical protein Q9169_008246, partial [Polycauliona sp. 2 TL-2023]
MKSIIASAVLGSALLVLHGVGAAVMPLGAVKRNEAFDARSEAIAEASSPAIKRADPASAMLRRDAAPKTTCIHTADGFIECGDLITKRENAVMPLMNAIEQRDEKKMRDGYPDIADSSCAHGYHFAQTSDHPEYCWQLNEKRIPQLHNWCYVFVPCDVPNGALPHDPNWKGEDQFAKRIRSNNAVVEGSQEAPQLKARSKIALLKSDFLTYDPVTDPNIDIDATTIATTESTTAATESTPATPCSIAAVANRGCSAKGKPFFFQDDNNRALCSNELVKGSETSQ